MSRTTGLLPASYKSVPFFVRQESLDDYGQKRITHNYPNSSVRYEEAQGVAPLQLTIDIFFQGANYKDDFELFKLAVEDQTPGILSVPTLGVFENIVARPASARMTQESIGEITTSVVFSETVEKPAPTSSVATSQDASASANTTSGLIGESF